MTLSKIYKTLVTEERVAWVMKHRHRLITTFLILGFISDIIIFRAIHLWLSQIILVGHLIVVATSLITISMPVYDAGGWFARIKPWVPFVHQYSTGALLSAFLILYSASTSLASSWPFFALVTVAAIANETLKLQKYWLPFQTTLFFLSLLLFCALAVPVALNDIGAATFLISIAVAAGAFVMFMQIALLSAPHAFKRNWFSIRLGWTAALGAVLLLYFTNLIPPIPLAMKDVGVYHSIIKNGNDYMAEGEGANWFEVFFTFEGQRLHLAPGASAYAFTAIFAPANLSANIVHRWQFWNQQTGEWETRDTIRFPIVGGREGGYRGYSRTENPTPGHWRVSVETVRGQVIGRVYMTIERVATPVETEIYTL